VTSTAHINSYIRLTISISIFFSVMVETIGMA